MPWDIEEQIELIGVELVGVEVPPEKKKNIGNTFGKGASKTCSLVNACFFFFVGMQCSI